MGGDLERIVSRLDIEKELEGLKPHPSPKVELEQYTTPASVAAELLFTASYIYDDVRDKLVADLGCGTGRLGIGAQILGAQLVVGVDVDPVAVKIAQENAASSDVLGCFHLVVGDISSLREVFDTVIMNPPFGTRRRHLDVKFLSGAMHIAKTIYSLHKSSTRSFLTGFVHGRGFEVSAILKVNLEIPYMFTFHRQRRRSVSVDLFRIAKSNR